LPPQIYRKQADVFDLPIAIGILIASGQLPGDVINNFEFVGELALTGELRGVQGCLPMAISTKKSARKIILPRTNAEEAALIKGLGIYPANHINEVCAHLTGTRQIDEYKIRYNVVAQNYPDLKEVRSQHQAKRAMEIAATGGHNLLMIGPPGSGKTMLAERLPGILPPINEQKALEVAAINSISNQGFKIDSWGFRPFRRPHHTASAIAMVGGGSIPRPGEISLAHNGVLFLDELPEYDRKVLEVLREPLESGTITISRAANQEEFPAKFQLIAAMNPCPCGYFGDNGGNCGCTPEQIRRYRARLSGPLLDRIDIHIEVPNRTREILHQRQENNAESSVKVRSRVMKGVKIQLNRAGKINNYLSNNEIEKYCVIDVEQKQLLEDAILKFNLSARSLHRILKVTKTLADLEQSIKIKTSPLVEAISYRRLDWLKQHLT